MKGRAIVIQPQGAGAIAALVVDGVLEDLLVDAPGDGPRPGDIHRVKVERRAPGQGAAHVRLEGGAKGWLREAGEVAEGALVVAQVTGVVEPGKPAPLSGRRLHRGRYAILTPGAPGVNVARAIRDREARARLAATPFDAAAAGGAGLILRSAAADADAAEIAAEIGTLVAAEAAIMAATGDAPALLARGPGAAEAARRDWAAPATEVIEGPDALDRLGLWERIDQLRGPRADLQGGGWMMVEPTAALVAVDVNTGGDLSPKAAARANLAAAAALPRELRLRGLGGQVVVDFAPMRKADRRAVEGVLSRALADDPVPTTLAGWTPLGHLELTRKRERRPLAEALPA